MVDILPSVQSLFAEDCSFMRKDQRGFSCFCLLLLVICGENIFSEAIMWISSAVERSNSDFEFLLLEYVLFGINFNTGSVSELSVLCTSAFTIKVDIHFISSFADFKGDLLYNKK